MSIIMIKYVVVICIGVAYVIVSRASAVDAANCRTVLSASRFGIQKDAFPSINIPH